MQITKLPLPEMYTLKLPPVPPQNGFSPSQQCHLRKLKQCTELVFLLLLHSSALRSLMFLFIGRVVVFLACMVW